MILTSLIAALSMNSFIDQGTKMPESDATITQIMTTQLLILNYPLKLISNIFCQNSEGFETFDVWSITPCPRAYNSFWPALSMTFG